MINENIKLGRQIIKDSNILDRIINIDPSPTKKYVGWLAKQYPFDIHLIKNTIEEFDTFVNKNKANITDINQFKSLTDLKEYVNKLNNQSTASLRELENNYTVILDNEDLYIVCPWTHEASRKLGLSKFVYGKECNWCTTFKNSDHWNDYFFDKQITFYYIIFKKETGVLNKI